MARSGSLILGLALALAGARSVPCADAASVVAAPAPTIGVPVNDPRLLAECGISARVVTGKIPTLNIRFEGSRILASWQRLRAAGLAGAGGDSAWARAHPLAAYEDVALAALPLLLRNVYRGDDTLDYVPVYARLVRDESGQQSEPLFSMNVNRAIVRKQAAAPDLAGRVVWSAWAEAEMHREQP